MSSPAYGAADGAAQTERGHGRFPTHRYISPTKTWHHELHRANVNTHGKTCQQKDVI